MTSPATFIQAKELSEKYTEHIKISQKEIDGLLDKFNNRCGKYKYIIN
jgi:hypothetical protein